MHVDLRGEGGIEVNPYSYTYTGDDKRVEQALQDWEPDGPSFAGGGFEDGEYYTDTIENEKEILANIIQHLQFFDVTMAIVDE